MTMTHTVADVMTGRVVSLSTTAPVHAAAEAMRDNDIGDVVVVENGVVRGLLTDRDIAVRVVAEGLNPEATVVGDVCSENVVATFPETSVGEAVKAMRDRAVRRLPVINSDGQAVGVVSIGDLAQSEDPRSALADISKAPPNA